MDDERRKKSSCKRVRVARFFFETWKERSVREHEETLLCVRVGLGGVSRGWKAKKRGWSECACNANSLLRLFVLLLLSRVCDRWKTARSLWAASLVWSPRIYNQPSPFMIFISFLRKSRPSWFDWTRRPIKTLTTEKKKKNVVCVLVFACYSAGQLFKTIDINWKTRKI